MLLRTNPKSSVKKISNQIALVRDGDKAEKMQVKAGPGRLAVDRSLRRTSGSMNKNIEKG